MSKRHAMRAGMKLKRGRTATATVAFGSSLFSFAKKPSGIENFEGKADVKAPSPLRFSGVQLLLNYDSFIRHYIE
jgi:hypothetical protein